MASKIKEEFCEKFLKTQFSEYDTLDRMYYNNSPDQKKLYDYYGEGKD